MIKTNLIKRESAGSYQAGKLLIPSLGVILIVQLFALSMKFVEAEQRRKGFIAAKQMLDAAKYEAQKFATSVDLQDLAGKVAARNNWLIDRRNNPLNRLAKLQKDCPNNIRFLSFNADSTSGKIILRS